MSTYHVGQAIEHLPVSVKVASAELEGYLSLPTAATGAVVFAHGSGSSRHSPRNRYVADVLNEGGLATLLIDLLNADEQEVDLQTSQLRFDIPFLANRLVAITQWLRNQPQLAGLKVGYFGASTGAAAALLAAAEVPRLIRAVVSRGGRPDLAGDDALAARAGAYTRDRWRQRSRGPGVEPQGFGANDLRQGIARHPRRQSSVRGARRAGGGGETGAAWFTEEFS